VAMAEVKGTMPEADPHYGHAEDEHAEPHDPGHVPDAAVAGGLVPGGAE
jgi:hypothetical protein